MPVALAVLLAAIGNGPGADAARLAVGAELPSLIAALGSPRFAEREAATTRLRAIGPLAGTAVAAAALSSDAEVRSRAETLVTGYRRSTARLRRSLTGDGQAIWTARFSPDGRTVAAGGRGKTLFVWDADTGKRRAAWPVGGHVSGLTFAPDGNSVFLACQEGRGVVRVDLDTGKVLKEYAPGEPGTTWYDASLSPDGKQLLATGVNRLALWDVATGKEVFPFPDAKKGGHSSAGAFAPDGKTFVTTREGDKSGTIRDAATGDPKVTFNAGWVGRVAFRPDGARFVTGNSEGKLVVWDAATAKPVWERQAHTGWACSPTYSPDGKRIVSGGHDAKFKLWDAATGAVIHEYGSTPGLVITADFRPDGLTVLSAGEDGAVRLWAVPP